MGILAPPELLGIHTNMAGVVPPQIMGILASNVLGAGYPWPTDLSDDENRTYDKLDFFFTHGVGYGVEMINRPQTLYGLADSPIAFAAWMLDHDAQSYDDVVKAFVEGKAVGCFTRDEILDNITLTWLTNTGVSSARLYWENKLGFFDAKGVTVPVLSPRSHMRSTPCRGVGPSRRTRTSSTSTRWTGETTLLLARA